MNCSYFFFLQNQKEGDEDAEKTVLRSFGKVVLDRAR